MSTKLPPRTLSEAEAAAATEATEEAAAATAAVSTLSTEVATLAASSVSTDEMLGLVKWLAQRVALLEAVVGTTGAVEPPPEAVLIEGYEEAP